MRHNGWLSLKPGVLAGMESLKDFIQSRRARWAEFIAALEEISANGYRGFPAERISRFGLLYRRVCADLAGAQTYFPGTRTTRMLNRMVVRAHGCFYRLRPSRRAELTAFFGNEFPAAFSANRVFLARSACLLLFGILLGFAATLRNPEFPRLFLSESAYSNFTEGTWRETGPVSLPGGMFFAGLVTNNVSVTFLAFAGGLLLGLGTASILILNGTLLGAVAMLSFETGAEDFFLHCVVAHGFLELSVIVLAGAAGMSIGDSLVDPGPYLRRDSLRLRSRDAIRLVLGGIPFLAIAALVEAFVSPSMAIPLWFKMLLGISLAVMFFTYPIVAGRKALHG